MRCSIDRRRRVREALWAVRSARSTLGGDQMAIRCVVQVVNSHFHPSFTVLVAVCATPLSW